MIEESKARALALLSQTTAVGGGYLGAGAGYLQSAFASQTEAIAHQIELWTSGEASTFKIISGDFQPGRALIVMDGLRLRNRGNALETVPFGLIKAVQEMHSEKRTSTIERAKSAAIGSAIGGVAGAASGMLAFMRVGGIGAAVGGTLGALLASRQKYQICRVMLRDERRIIAVAESTNWLALLASIPREKSRLPWRR